jgi:hypothetical protein
MRNKKKKTSRIKFVCSFSIVLSRVVLFCSVIFNLKKEKKTDRRDDNKKKR